MDDYPKVFTRSVSVANCAPREVHDREITYMIQRLIQAIIDEEMRIDKHEDFTEYTICFYLASPDKFREMVRRAAERKIVIK